MKRMLSLICVLGLLVLTACGGSTAPSAPADPLPVSTLHGLPTVDSLREVSAGEPVPRFSLADAFLAGASQQTTGGAAAGSLLFQPDFPGSGPAWAIYGLDLSSYNGPDEATLQWTTEPAEGQLYIGVANFDSSRWDWQLAADPVQLSVPTDAAHRSPSGRLFLSVLVMGSAEAELDWLRIGGNIPPVVELFADNTSGSVPFAVTLTAVASDLDGAISLFSFDELGDGNFVTNGTTAEWNVTYTDPGLYMPVVKVNDGEGGEAMAAARVGAGWIHSYGEAGYDSAAACIPGPGGTLLHTGLANSWGQGGNECALLSWDASGLPGLQFCFGTSNGETFIGIQRNDSGDILMCGSVFDFGSFSNSPVLLKSDSAGNIIYQKQMLTLNGTSDNGAVLAPNGVVTFAGANRKDDISGIDLVRIGTNGIVVTQRRYEAAESLLSPQLYRDSGNNTYLLCTESSADGNDLRVIVLSPTLELVWSSVHHTIGDFRLGDAVIAGNSLVICGSLESPIEGESGAIVFSVSAAEGNLEWQNRLDFSGQSGWLGLSRQEASGDLFLVGSIPNQDVSDTTACGIIGRCSANGVIQEVQAFNQANFNNNFDDIAEAPDGSFYITGTGPDNNGSWYEPDFLQFSESANWTTQPLTFKPSTVGVVDWTAVRSDLDVPAPVLDSGGGGNDMLVMRWFQP
ncbi:PKD domain-containing protein [bacterium]|nr:PKD domain-containing protein [bacterium]